MVVTLAGIHVMLRRRDCICVTLVQLHAASVQLESARGPVKPDRNEFAVMYPSHSAIDPMTTSRFAAHLH